MWAWAGRDGGRWGPDRSCLVVLEAGILRSGHTPDSPGVFPRAFARNIEGVRRHTQIPQNARFALDCEPGRRGLAPTHSNQEGWSTCLPATATLVDKFRCWEGPFPAA